ncbi:Por secretion system C-terminal sorting domain protein [Solibacillus isronensis B3W22]|uniref:Secretion system C-terminal sorting domain-containing protein n=2 Tax=Bacteria TaxID=2 RepID=M7NA04_9BACT|nr:Por secretion system C-terminal sorting domain protein [Solibacillus isronensis B3W22]EMR04097.1 hypothetical protein ADICEAN_00720 [Cesiribacter andamanensis AMV16]
MLSLKKDKMVAYPVPFSNKLTLEFYIEQEGNFQVNLYDMGGKLVKQLKTGTSLAGEMQRVEVNGLGLHDGMYLVSVMSGKEKQTIRIIKKE